ncbi:hypothetical protein CQA53_07240 [Helicobacter didelphidarum]|uniref:Helicase HerA central domain-containing protein n=1 Tax=Helicobacter didelphidarum TaxID=2040648 RepID=A0A3D8IIB4_9HELI|nr:DUF87 domain-containing protein [Helicobacter didelphidarum]RDU64942.1 hypothetical protein CQA53_07240 [Helicobacter didelphidarum]
MGIYSGSEVKTSQKTSLNNSTTKQGLKITPRLESLPHNKAMLGVPSLKRDSDKEYKQGLEKIIFPLRNALNADNSNQKFRIIIVAESYPQAIIQEILQGYRELGDEVHKFVKISKNAQKSRADSQGKTDTKGSSKSHSESHGETESESYSEGISEKSTLGKALGIGAAVAGVGAVVAGSLKGGYVGGIIGGAFAGGIMSATSNLTKTNTTSTTTSTSTSRTTSTSVSTNESTAISQSRTDTHTAGITIEELNKTAQYCEELIDTYIQRFQKGLNHGMWNTALYISASDSFTLDMLEHTLKSVYSGDESHFEALRFSQDFKDFAHHSIYTERLPMVYSSLLQHPIHNSFSGLSSALSTEELSILTAMPCNDIEGISVSHISSFGLTQAKTKEGIILGNVLNKKKPTHQDFVLGLESLNSHLFVSGITGGGKSNTIKHILTALQSEEIKNHFGKKIPFLVIEPAKSEYKGLIEHIPHLQIFRPGASDDIFRFNPFVFEHSRDKKGNAITLTKHVDMLKVSFSSAFPMYGPMPAILEEAISEVYRDRGWSFETEDNVSFTSAKDSDKERESLLFPNMIDLSKKIDSVVQQAGYAGELDSNLKAALKTRIRNLTLGVKGKIFNSRHAFHSEVLFEKPTIIELSHITNDEEKSFLMGLLLNKLYQYRESEGDSHNQLKHLTIIEEAHRLLPNISLDKSSEEANARGKAVETFTNILAEIRSFGEGIIIADQIASKLHRDVIKNTNVKILHRTMDKEDRELVGNAINLNEKQILDIAELKAGEAIVHNKDIHQAFMVKIKRFENYPNKADSTLSQKALKERMQSKITDFIHKFLESRIAQDYGYQYEFLLEQRFYLPYEKRERLNSIESFKARKAVLELLLSAFFTSELQKSFGDFTSLICEGKRKADSPPLTDEEKRLNVYLFLKGWQELRYISSITYYKNIDCYLSIYKEMLRLINHLNENEEEKIQDSIASMKEYLQHKKLKNVTQAMRHCKTHYEQNGKSDFFDCFWILKEYAAINEEIHGFIHTKYETREEQDYQYEVIWNKYFAHTQSDLLYYTLQLSKI